MYNAFYYRENYYLLPEEYPDYQSFMEAIDNGCLPIEVCAVSLREDHGIRNSVTKGRSIAPYFLSGYHDEPCCIEIADKEDVYPVQAEVYSQEAYNARLRELIQRHCPGCLRYKPLSNRVQSLNGHFEEMSLDGVCLFRQESKPTPRSFHNHLFSFGGFYMRFNYYTKPAPGMMDELKHWFYVRYAHAELNDCGNHKELILTGRKNELLLPVLTDAISDYLAAITKQAYLIRLADPRKDMRSWFDDILSEQNRDAYQKECKKYGVSIGVLEYDPHAEEKIRRCLKPLIDHFWMFSLLQENGKEYFLVADTPYVLKELRYRSPLLQTYHTRFSVFGQYGNRCYDISFDMSSTEQ